MGSAEKVEFSAIEDSLYKDLIEEASFGYAFLKLVYDNRGIPCDFKFIHVNKAFENITHLKREQMFSGVASKVIPEIQSSRYDWLGLFSSITGKQKKIIERQIDFGKWFRVEVSSPRKDHCIILLFDISEQKLVESILEEKAIALKNHVEEMNMLVKLSGLMQERNSSIRDFLRHAVELVPSAWKNPLNTAARIRYNDYEFTTEKFYETGDCLKKDLIVFNKIIGAVEIHYLDKEIIPKSEMSLRHEHELIDTLAAFLESAIEKMESLQALKENESKLRLYFENAPDGIFIANPEGQFTEVNPAACSMLGFSENELLKMQIPDVVPKDSPEPVQHREEFLKNGVFKERIEVVKKDGSKLPVAISCVILPDKRLMAFCKDVSKRKKVEQEVALYYSAIQSVAQPMIITDSNGQILEINKAFTNMYGYSKEEIVGENPNVLNPGKKVYTNLGYTEQGYFSIFDSLWRAVINPDVGTWENEIINRKKDGSLLWVRLMVNGVYDKSRKLKNIIGLPIDISNIRERETTCKIQLYRTIADMAELRDNETGNHMRRVGIFSKMIAKKLGMPQKYCDDIEVFAPMHDIGKVGILDSILLARRKLTLEEFNEMKNHTILGYNIVKGNHELELAAAITLSHHERFDGKGYPHGLERENIPLSARITAIADVYDALRSKRPYKDGWPHNKTREEIVRNAGTQFDPELVAIFDHLNSSFDDTYNALRD
ncbi:PAS domain S-box protein [Chitinispirillales bacterium ANBcel5]|uniref:PAS domain S-box protein n=1 Tax=Cellulosispirillum alkaliphilum TaxID=3039283 RepID=UPI002A5912A4|nr:PAS domain S-box protein [Chitinispirillales bacterium ANBcel5]